MKRAHKVFIDENEFDFDKCVEIACEYDDSSSGAKHSIVGHIDDNNSLCLKVSHYFFEDDGSYSCSGELKNVTTIVKLPLDELM